jgi:hypothetical protein
MMTVLDHLTSSWRTMTMRTVVESTVMVVGLLCLVGTAHSAALGRWTVLGDFFAGKN